MKYGWGVMAALFLAGAIATQTRAEAPLAGCYERVYDDAHLKAHRGQIVRHVRLKLGPTSVPKSEGGDKPPIVDAILQMWVGTGKTSFDSLGVCWMENDGLICNGSDSAAEAKVCKTKKDGVRDCRRDDARDGRFRIAAKGEGVLLSIVERLELPQTGSDVGPYLYLSPDNAENHDFLLKAAPAAACK